MLQLSDCCAVASGVAPLPGDGDAARFVRLADVMALRHGREPALTTGVAPDVARALPIEIDDLIVSARGVSTDVAIATEAVVGAFVTLDLFLVRPNRDLVEPAFLLTVLELPETQAILAASKQGSGLPRLPKEALEAIMVPIPDRQRQRSIAALAECIQRERRLLEALQSSRANLSRALLRRAIKSVGSA
jgi:hypothetical protein